MELETDDFSFKKMEGIIMAKLVAFYSRADENYFGGSMQYIKVGNTEKVAKMISEITGADMYKIEQKIPYAADYNTCIAEAKKDLQAKTRPELVNMIDSIDEYDEIYLGYFHSTCGECSSKVWNNRIKGAGTC